MSIFSSIAKRLGSDKGGAVELRDVGPWDIPWSNRGQSVGYVDETSAYNLSSVWACQTLIADSIATLPFDTFRKQDRQRIPTTPPAWMIKPNPEWNRIEFETQRLLSLLGWGNAYVLLVRQNGSTDPMAPILERWVLNPAYMMVRRRHNPTDVRDAIVYYYLGQEVPLGNIQHIRGYTLPGYWMGMSPIAQMNRTLVLSVEAQNAGLNFYQQGMMLGGVLEVPAMPAEVSKEITDRLSEDFSQRHAGAGNAGKPAVLTGGTTWKETTVNPTDAALLETRKFEINEVCRWYRVPPHKIADIVAHASQGGGMGIEQQATEFAQDTLLPWTARLEEADSALIPRGQFMQYDLDASIRTDILTRMTAAEKGRNAGIFSANDWRTNFENLPPIPNGDIYLQPLNFTEAGKEPPAPPEPPKLPEPIGVPSGPQ